MVMNATLFSRSGPGELASLDNATQWLGSEPLTADALKGRVVLVGFWTFSCINWLRTLPYLRAWGDKYREQGLVVIGVHTPEFEFEHDLDNVRRAADQMRVTYPIVIDNDYAIWQAFSNSYWPALYFVDARGQVRHHQFGEGDYEESEAVLKKLLAEAGASDLGSDTVEVDINGYETAADWLNLKSPENYLGYDRTSGFASPDRVPFGSPGQYGAPARLRLNEWALTGEWTVSDEFVLQNGREGRIITRFHARDLNVVMGASSRADTIDFRVLVDGQPPAGSHGVDVDAGGNGSVSESRLYQLIRQPGDILDRTVEIRFLSPGVRAYSMTFG